MRAPVIAGVAGGVGTSTVAVALRGRDAGRCVAGSAADVVVCRYSADSLYRTAAMADLLSGARPVLAVTADAGSPASLQAMLRAIGPRFEDMVVLPHIARWRELTDPLAEAEALLTQPVERLPRLLRAYVAALLLLTAAVTGSGRLDRSEPAMPRSVAHWPSEQPVERWVAPRPLRIAAPLDPALAMAGAHPASVSRSVPDEGLDDDALEAEPFGRHLTVLPDLHPMTAGYAAGRG